MFEDNFDFQNTDLRCMRCGQIFEEKQLVARTRIGGCLPVTTYECAPCSEKTEREDKARKYQEEHFCSRCNERFKRPFFKNRKHLSIKERWGYRTNSYCLPCFEIERARLPKEEQEIDLWPSEKGTATQVDEEGLW